MPVTAARIRYRRNRLSREVRRGKRVLDAYSGFFAYEEDCVRDDKGFVDSKVHEPDINPKTGGYFGGRS